MACERYGKDMAQAEAVISKLNFDLDKFTQNQDEQHASGNNEEWGMQPAL